MRVNQYHPPVFSDPIEFSFPNGRRLLAQENKHSEVLSQSIRKFHVTAAWSGNPKRENCINAVRLRLKWVRVESGRVVQDIQLMQPVEPVVHESGAKTHDLPVGQVSIDFLRVVSENGLRKI